MAKNQHEFNEKSEPEICVDDEPTHSSMEQKTCAESFQKDFSAIDNLLRVLQKGKIAAKKAKLLQLQSENLLALLDDFHVSFTISKDCSKT